MLASLFFRNKTIYVVYGATITAYGFGSIAVVVSIFVEVESIVEIFSVDVSAIF